MTQENKLVLMAALSYNLKKYLIFVRKNPQILAQSRTAMQGQLLSLKTVLITFRIKIYKLLINYTYKIL